MTEFDEACSEYLKARARVQTLIVCSDVARSRVADAREVVSGLLEEARHVDADLEQERGRLRAAVEKLNAVGLKEVERMSARGAEGG